MARYNTTFDLSLEDMDLIETALRKQMHTVSTETPDDAVDMQSARDINDLLGRLHNQKIFYRPARSAYVSG